MKKLTKIAACALACASLFIAGCDELPSVDKITTMSTLIGRTAGYACELANLKPEVKEAVFTVLDVVSKATPEPGKTFTETWSPLIDEELAKLVAAGKLNETGAMAAKIALKSACEGLDYVFTKYPKAKDVEELVSAAVKGFVAGFRGAITVSAGAKVEIDEEAYAYIKAKIGK